MAGGSSLPFKLRKSVMTLLFIVDIYHSFCGFEDIPCKENFMKIQRSGARGELIQFWDRESADSKIESTPTGKVAFS